MPFQKVRYLFRGWKRFLVSVQWVFLGMLLIALVVLTVRSFYANLETGLNRQLLLIPCCLTVGILYSLQRSWVLSRRALSLLLLTWGTFLWVDAYIPGRVSIVDSMFFLRKSGADRFVLMSFSLIGLLGLGYPFDWLERVKHGIIVVGAGLISFLGFLSLNSVAILERGSEGAYIIDLIGVVLILVVVGASLLVRDIQECLVEGSRSWRYVPYTAGVLMFLLTMSLWSNFRIYERKSLDREIEVTVTRMVDKLEQKLVALTQDLERFCLTESLREKVKLDDWRLETKVFMAHEPSLIGFERVPFINSSWSAPRYSDGKVLEFLSEDSLNHAIRSSKLSRAAWLTPPFRISSTSVGMALVGMVDPKNDNSWWVVMGFELNSIFDSLYREESELIHIRVLAQQSIVRDFESRIDLRRQMPFISDFYFHGATFQFIVLPKGALLAKRDRFLSLGFLMAGCCFSVLFGVLVGLYIQTHDNSLVLRGINEELEGEVRERRNAEEETDQKNKDLETLIYVVSHDLREPLRGIESFSRLVYERYVDRLDEKGQDFLRRIVFSSMRLDRLLDDITTLSRAQRADPPTVPVPARDLVMEAMGRLETVIKTKSAKVHIERDLPLLWVNRTWGTQAIFNLMGNALKFSGQDHAPDIEIRGFTSESGDQTGIVVLDRGPGVKAEHVERIFKLFQRAVGRDVEGTGAGLAIVRQIALRHGGRVWYEPRDGGGSCFTICFSNLSGSLKDGA